jgi:hypothetical protein
MTTASDIGRGYNAQKGRVIAHVPRAKALAHIGI